MTRVMSLASSILALSLLAQPALAAVRDPEVVQWLGGVRSVLDGIGKCKEREVTTAKTTLEEIDRAGRLGLDPAGLRGNLEDLGLLIGAAEIACGKDEPTNLPPMPTPQFMAGRPVRVEPGSLAVLPIQAPDVDPAAAKTIEAALRGVAGSQLTPLGFKLLANDSRGAKKALRAGRICDAQCALDAAKTMGAKSFLLAIVVKQKTGFVASLRAYDTAHGALVGSTRVEGATPEAVATALEAQAPELFRRLGPAR